MKKPKSKSKNLWTVSSLLNKNFLVRTLSGAGLLVIVLGAVLWSPFSMLVLMAVLMAGSLTEFFRIARLKGARPLVAYPVVIGLSALALAFAVQTGRCPASAFALLLPMIFALFVAELYRRHENPLGNVCWELGGLVYIALPFALLATIPLRGACSAGSSYVPGDMLAIIFIVWANDVGAYLAGSLFGRHRLFERISPKKSWEGFAGGVLCAVAVGWLYGLYAGPGDTAHGLLWSGAGLVVAVAGVLGDLVESMLKRSAGLKDSRSRRFSRPFRRADSGRTFRLCVFRYICLYLCAERRPGRSRCRLNQTITHENP